MGGTEIADTGRATGCQPSTPLGRNPRLALEFVFVFGLLEFVFGLLELEFDSTLELLPSLPFVGGRVEELSSRRVFVFGRGGLEFNSCKTSSATFPRSDWVDDH
mmetsp:Transcript_21626/g.35812  ORF Transcript_21626/g.35812 Transcript_21626/m.35812 type:complete len:104 (-) Transcript_21626:557-868(-)